jgi:fermentation-respiration switch protein FrsA (DUF1100 family)
VRVPRRAAAAAALVVAAALLVWLGGGRRIEPGHLLTTRSTTEPAGAGGWSREAVQLVSQRGMRLECRLRRPAERSGGRVPAVLVAGGLRTGRDAADVVGETFRGVTFACDYPFLDPGLRSIPSFLLRLPRTRAEILSTPAAHRLAADYLLSRPDVDSSRFAAAGVSLGVPTIAAWAAGDPRPRAVALLYGGGRLDLVLERALGRRLKWGWLRSRVAAALAGLLGQLEPVHNAPRIAPRPLLIITAQQDERVPTESFEALIAAAGEPKTVIRLAGTHVGGDAALLATLTDSVTVWLSSAAGID